MTNPVSNPMSNRVSESSSSTVGARISSSPNAAIKVPAVRSMSTTRAAAILLAKELRLEFRSREILTATVVFSLMVIMFFSYVFEPTAAESRRYGPGLLWIAFLFAGSLMLHPSFAREQNNDTLDALRMAPISPFAILLGQDAREFRVHVAHRSWCSCRCSPCSTTCRSRVLPAA